MEDSYTSKNTQSRKSTWSNEPVFFYQLLFFFSLIVYWPLEVTQLSSIPKTDICFWLHHGIRTKSETHHNYYELSIGDKIATASSSSINISCSMAFYLHCPLRIHDLMLGEWNLHLNSFSLFPSFWVQYVACRAVVGMQISIVNRGDATPCWRK
jgi:hypothetical protein